MAYEPLHHRYRPQRFDQLVGQGPIVRTLSNAIRRQRIAPAYLFTGPRGTGKTSSARILARSLNCTSSPEPTAEPCGHCETCTAITSGSALDVIEIDAASNTGVDNIRDLIERARFAPVQMRWKVYVVDECHMLSTAAFNALLKTLEEPPPRVVFVLATTDPQRVLPTIVSRCQRFDFCRIPLEELMGHLGWIAQQEQIVITPDALRLVAQFAQGGLRDGESLLDQLSLLTPPIEASAVWELMGAVPEQELLDLGKAMAKGDPLLVLEVTRRLFERGYEPNAILQALTTLLRDLLLAALAPDRQALTTISPASWSTATGLAKDLGQNRLLGWLRALKGSEAQLRHSSQPRLTLEVLLAGLLATETQATVQATPLPTTRSGAPQSPAAVDRSAVGHGQPAPAPAAPLGVARVTTRAAGAPPSAPSAPLEGEGEQTRELEKLWLTILGHLKLPATQTLLQQQAHVASWDGSQLLVQVNPPWLTMIQARLPLLEEAAQVALNQPAQIKLSSAPSPGVQSRPSQGKAPPRPTQKLPPQQAPPQQGPPRQQGSNANLPKANSPRLPDQPTPGEPRQAQPISSPPSPNSVAGLDATARKLADFFNGEVVDRGPE